MPSSQKSSSVPSQGIPSAGSSEPSGEDGSQSPVVLQGVPRVGGARPLAAGLAHHHAEPGGFGLLGPGEAAGADLGVSLGRGRAHLFKRGENVGTVAEDGIVEAVLSAIENWDEGS